MSFITRCPSCSTSFKVVADQLRVSQGWVRCGHCADIFDANQDLKPWVPTPPVLTTVVDDEEQPSDRAWAQQAQVTQAPADVSQPNEQPIEAQTTEPIGDHDPVLAEPQEPTWAASETAEPNAGHAPHSAPMELPIDLLQADSDELRPAVPEAEPRFVREAKRQAFWAARPVRMALWSGVFLSVLGLALQWAIHDRHRLAAWQPALKPVLTAICQPLGCSIGAVRQLKAVVIDSSALVHLLEQLYAFDVVLKNTHAWPVSLPSLDLRLNDAQEQPLARRVILSQDWPDAPQVLAPGESWPLKLRLSIALPSGQTMAGYRVELFYP